MSQYRLIFAGTPEFAVPALQALHQAGHQITAVYTQPDRPAGRGRKLQPSPVKQYAEQHGLAVYQPRTLRDADAAQQLIEHQADFMIVAAYGLILPPEILTAPRFSCINIHASLLPRWRGAAPIAHAILAGDAESGITIMQMDEGLDTGDMLAKYPCPIQPSDTSQSLLEKLAALGAEAITESIAHYSSLTAQSQNNQQACYAGKIQKSDGAIDWQQTAEQIGRGIRAFNPWPMAFSRLDDEIIRIQQASVKEEPSNAPAGSIIAIDKRGVTVATGKGQITLEVIQLPGKTATAAGPLALNKPNLFTIGKSFLSHDL